MLKNIHIKLFHIKILIETFSLDGFILNYEKNRYSISSLNEKCDTLNKFIKMHGIYEIYNKLFQYNINNLTDLIGNKCIRSIIRKKLNDNIYYEYKTIAIYNDIYIDPIDRIPSLMNISQD